MAASESDAGNAAPYSVSELAAALKRTVESTYGFVRVRGELSRVTRPASGHVYFELKDANAAIACVVWRGQAQRLAIRPDEGLEVVVTGRMTTYPARSTYQLVVETMEPEGVGALLAQLERLKAKLKAEGLFDAARKRPLPAMPSVIGVVTSPTGAVIQDILHRIADRWPCRVLLWPALVQGEQAAAQVKAAIEGFGALPEGGPIPRPEVLIVARGGGSVQDLWPFNDEGLARAAAASPIPLISAVGHETDTTLIDFVADRRAPTPTAAAELATPVRAELVAAILDLERRMAGAGARALEMRRTRLAGVARGLPRPVDLVGLAGQRLDNAAQRLAAALRGNVGAHARALAAVGATLRPRLLTGPIEADRGALGRAGARLSPALARQLKSLADRAAAAAALLASLEPRAPLRRGFALVRRSGGGLATRAADLSAGEAVGLEFADSVLGAHIDGETHFALTPGP